MSAPTASAPVLAPEGPTTAEAVLAWVKVKDTTAAQDEVADVVEAVNNLIRADGLGWLPVPAVGQPWPAAHSLGARMLAGRLWRRRNSPGGVETFGAEGAVYVQRTDPDVAQLLGLGAYAKPDVG